MWVCDQTVKQSAARQCEKIQKQLRLYMLCSTLLLYKKNSYEKNMTAGNMQLEMSSGVLHSANSHRVFLKELFPLCNIPARRDRRQRQEFVLYTGKTISVAQLGRFTNGWKDFFVFGRPSVDVLEFSHFTPKVNGDHSDYLDYSALLQIFVWSTQPFPRATY